MSLAALTKAREEHVHAPARFALTTWSAKFSKKVCYPSAWHFLASSCDLPPINGKYRMLFSATYVG
jgi:hypothetical protein